ncbi:MAG: low temperature requirement protein A [Actinobacteria bacterium]|nr:low temperature requirement protein A [Actinomycetota bacterium]
MLRDPAEEHRTATWLELFFDLCFVVAVAALARGLHDDPTLGGVLRFAGLFVPVWWAWMGFTWYATAFDNDDVPYRVSLLGAMLCILWLAASIDGLAEGRVLSFVLAYVALKTLLVGLFLRARRDASNVRAFATWYAAGNALGAAIWLSSLLVPEPGRYAVWAVALFVELLAPILAVRASGERGFHPEHIRERYGLFTLIVLGEAVLAVAAGTAGSGWDPTAVLTGVFGFVAAACIWWLYFDYVESSALTLGSRAAFFWGYGHLFIYASIAAFGVGIQLAIEGSAEPELLAAAAGAPPEGSDAAGASAILGGGAAAVYLLAISFIRSGCSRLPRGSRLVAGAACVHRDALPAPARPDGVRDALRAPVRARSVKELRTAASLSSSGLGRSVFPVPLFPCPVATQDVEDDEEGDQGDEAVADVARDRE